MNPTSTQPALNLASTPLNLELIAQRVLKLAEIAMLEHLDSLAGSQAEGLIELVEQMKRAN